jgi:CheY-like chemotaxis protein
MTRGGPTVLLAEDNPTNMELTLLALESGRCANHIDVVREGAEALDHHAVDEAEEIMPHENGPRAWCRSGIPCR